MLPVNDCTSCVYSCFCSARSVPLIIKFLPMSSTVLVTNKQCKKLLWKVKSQGMYIVEDNWAGAIYLAYNQEMILSLIWISESHRK